MLLLTDRTRKVSAILSSVWMLVLTLSPTLTAVADDAAFSAGQAAGQTGVTQSMQVFQNTNQLQNMGITGLGTQSAPSNLTTLYKGQGKNGADSIGALNQAGVQAMQASQTCASTDAACQARKSLNTNYNNAQSGISSTAAYKQRAKAIQAAQSSMDPLAILGIGIPSANGGSVCVNSTTTSPAYTTSQSCLQATFQTIKYTPVTPVTSNVINASPYCLDPTMTLTSNQALCTKTTYNCPSGGSLSGQQCTDVTAVGFSYTSPYCIDPSMTLSGGNCSKTVYSCPNGGTLNGTQCVITSSPNVSYSGCATANSGGSWTQYIANGQDWWQVQAKCGTGTIDIYADAAGGWGNGGTAGNWVSLPIGSYNNKYTHISTPSWNSSLQAYATAVTGGCSGGTCSYNISFDWANFGVPYTACTQLVYDWMTDTYQCKASSSGYDWVHNIYSSLSHQCDSEGNCRQATAQDVRTALANGWVQSGFTKVATLSFPQNASYSCPSGGTVQNGQCVMTYPATASYQSATPGCMGGYNYTNGTCQSVPVCPTGYSKINTTSSGITCSKTYPATPNTTTASPGCYTPILPAGASSGGTQLTATMVNGQAGMMCQTIYYSCPAGMNMNGMQCEDPSKMTYQNNPNCKFLGTNLAQGQQAFLCINNKLDECLQADLTGCTNTSNTCVYVDDVVGSNTYNQCIATEKKYTCPKPQQAVSISTCGYEPMCYNGNCFTPPGTQCEATPTGDQCTTDLSQVLVSMETARQAGTYMNPDDLKIFKGEFSRCDRRAFSVLGAGLGSKSCCNISAPDAKSNADILGSSLAQSAGFSLLKQGVSKSSQYMYDYMMSSNAFMSAGNSAWAAGLMSDSMQAAQASAADLAAKGIENFTWTPSVEVMGVTASFGGIGTGWAGTGSWVGKNLLSESAASMLSPTQLGTLGTPFGDLTFSVDPVSLGIQAAWMAWQAYNAALACDEQDYNTATKTNGKLCYSTGTWCESKDCGLFGCTCTKYRTGKCCFNSKLSRIINEQGRAQLGLDMRDCGGFSTAQIQQLDWSRIDLSEFIADMLAQAQASTANIMNNAVPTLQTQTSTITTNNARNKVQPSLPIKQ